MPSMKRRNRTQHSYRDAIRDAIMVHRTQGLSLSVRAIIAAAGGGSSTTVLEELAASSESTSTSLNGRFGQSPYQRIYALESAARERESRLNALKIANAELNRSLHTSRLDVEKLLRSHQDSQRQLLQAVDDFRQMAKSIQNTGSVARSPDVTDSKPIRSADAVLWQAKHDQLLERFISLEAKYRALASQLHELGGTIE